MYMKRRVEGLVETRDELLFGVTTYRMTSCLALQYNVWTPVWHYNTTYELLFGVTTYRMNSCLTLQRTV